LIGAGTIINPILKVVTTVAILGAVYLFFVKPILDTTEDITGDVSRQTQQAFQDAEKASDEFDLNFAKDRAESFASTLRTQWPEAAREVTNCVRQANKDAKAMEKCDEFGHQLITEGQSPRNFSLSYADSLAAQGDAAAAAQVENCVEDAAFNVRELQRCRDLADRLLFP
jgi:5'-deoxynucleotidase YfbR-like HD superfamily hydrolase